MDNPANNDSDQRLRARLALTSQDKIADWQKEEGYLDKRKKEAALALASDEQKKLAQEKEQARINKEEAQKKLEAMENARREAEELKKRDASIQQREQDLAKEKKRQERIKEILESQKEIEQIRKKPDRQLSSLHTLTEDLNNAVKNKGFTAESLIRSNQITIKEEEQTVSRKKVVILTISLILFFAGATAVTWSLWQKTETSKATLQFVHNSIIFADDHLEFPLGSKTPEQLQQEIRDKITVNNSANINRGKIEDIYFTYEEKKYTNQGIAITKNIAGPTLFASSTGLAITDDLLRFLDPDFMLGIYTEPQQAKPFYLFKTTSYKNVADALLRSENIIISQLLLPFLNEETVEKIRNTSFQNKMVANRDIRMVSDSNNQTMAVYSWLDKNTLVITTDEQAIQTILTAFLTPKPVAK